MAPRPRTNHDSDEEFESYRLRDISPRQLDQLTDLLWMDPGVNVAAPDRDWLLDQKSRIGTLDKSNRRSTKLLGRLSARLESLNLKYVDGDMPTACLCAAHHGLDPKLIRRLMLLLIAECTERVQVLRIWRQRIAFSDNIIAWLDRIDTVTGLWIGRDAFRATFGYQRASPTDLKVKSKCEACIMAVVGGRPQVLSDLRASMIQRRDRHFDRTGGKGPRLLRLVESWIDHFDADCRRAVLTASTEVGNELDELLGIIKSLKRERTVSGTSSRSSHHRQSRAYERKEERHERGYRERPASYGQSSRQSNSSRNYHEEGHRYPRQELSHDTLQAGGEENWMDEDEDCQASIWMDCQMQHQGLTAEERRQLFEDDMHPAFSDYAPTVVGVSMDDRLQRDFAEDGQSDERFTFSIASAVPAPLKLTREIQRPPSPARSTSVGGTAETVWEAVSVFSPPASVAGGVPSRRDTVVLNRDNDGESITTTFDDGQAHLQFCQKWGFTPNSESDTPEPATPRPQPETYRDADTFSIVAASSVYSAHPGFRRSQENLASSPQRDRIYRHQPEDFSRIPFDLASNGGRFRPPSRAPSSRSSHVSTQRRPDEKRGKSLWNQLREDRQRLIEEMDEE
ncbi:hypothetical protein FSARC_7708 [Fusarium sarcochroum]|uniref:Uncharacterized protein n=1 Tax=Fusarium sarcochroum TaxID=1208366 RepID=A0A8H4TUE2_9HYPO|nr:hypothetical protein FSARC_7708 [Fusarium sarcochroum]